MLSEYKINNGFIKVIDKLGTDATVVNAARVSYGKQIENLEEKDVKLLNYLAKHGHFSPFRSCIVQFHIKAPEFVGRQFWKHIVGSDYSFPATQWNEISGRYVQYEPEPYIPETLRKQSQDSKQGSSEEVFDRPDLLEKMEQGIRSNFKLYDDLIKEGVAKELARIVLPLAFYTEWYWTASLQAIHHFVKLRKDAHAQKEIQEYAVGMNSLMTELYPYSWNALNTI